MSKNVKGKLVEAITSMVDGLQKHFAGQTLVLNGDSVTVEAVVASLQGFLEQLKRSDAAHAVWKQELEKTDAQEDTKVTPLMRSLRRQVQAAFGAKSAVLVDFGITPLHTAAVSVEARAAGVQKSLKTRVARHTMGRRQRQAIHGSVDPTPMPTPVTVALPTSAPQPTPALVQAPTPIAISPAPQPAAPTISTAPSSPTPGGPIVPLDKAA